MFKPEIGRPLKTRNVTPDKTWNRLYSTADQSKQMMRRKPNCQKLTNKKSEEIIKSMKDQRYVEFFQQLKPVDGHISQETIKNHCLPDDIRTILGPLLEDLTGPVERISFNEFYENMEVLMRALTPAEKSTILTKRKKMVKPREFRFRPYTNGKQTPQRRVQMHPKAVHCSISPVLQ